jgi:glycosyltransferase involved in cell wall biosynthesis
MADKIKICILLGVYNGMEYLHDQIASIINQDHALWEMLARDDASDDFSMNELKSCAAGDSRIHLVQDSFGNRGVVQNFGLLMEKALSTSSDYFVFSDQDDVWMPDKLSCQLDVLRKIEAAFPDQPVMVHSDLEVVDASLHPIACSFMKYQGIRNQVVEPVKNLLIQNFVTGCTMMINRKLLEKALPIPETALMHDWWVALCASVLGRIGFINRPLLKYRQHGKNNVGAKSVVAALNPLKGRWCDIWLSGMKNLSRSFLQAHSLSLRILEHDPYNPYTQIVQAYASLLNLSPVRRVFELNRQGICSQSFLRHLLTVSRLLVL